ncbi:hypothetical protein [Phaeodactylibacter xiamenensis]|uniref:hypothetical protein n=1 Tax=Phaeodactylibacter xiamenensis TaxID=1524460 RepID=UPI0024A8DE59|nr:hypothetical protein [Phaeodactylibacter xiamenensis]
MIHRPCPIPFLCKDLSIYPVELCILRPLFKQWPDDGFGFCVFPALRQLHSALIGFIRTRRLFLIHLNADGLPLYTDLRRIPAPAIGIAQVLRCTGIILPTGLFQAGEKLL